MSERRIFEIINEVQHPFLVNLYSCFQTEVSLLKNGIVLILKTVVSGGVGCVVQLASLHACLLLLCCTGVPGQRQDIDG